MLALLQALCSFSHLPLGFRNRDLRPQVAQLLNTKVGNVYLFSGDDTGNPPVPDTTPATIIAGIQGGSSGAPAKNTDAGTSAKTPPHCVVA